MKEIDFLPQWYKSGQKRRVNYYRLYAVIIALFAVSVAWSFATGFSLSRAEARVKQLRQARGENLHMSAEYTSLNNTITKLRQKNDILTRLDPKLKISNVLTEVSFLVTENIVLGKLDIQCESFQNGSVSAGFSTVRLGQRQRNAETVMPEEDRRFRVVMAGIASDPADVAVLIARLEESSYFCQVIPSFSRNKKTKKIAVTEFEITCFVANYVEHSISEGKLNETF